MGASGSDSKLADEQLPLMDKPVNEQDMVDETHISVPARKFDYNYGVRPCRDAGFAIVFLIALVASLGFGIVAVFRSNPDYRLVESAHYQPDRGCSLPAVFMDSKNSGVELSNLVSRDKFRKLSDQSGNLSLGEDPSTKAAKYVVIITLLVSFPSAYILLWLLRTYTSLLVKVTLPFFLLIPVTLNITWFTLCFRNDECTKLLSPTIQISVFIFVFLVSILFLWVIYANWNRIELTIKIIRTAAEALYRNLGLLLVLPGLSVGLLFYLIPAAAFLYYAETNGRIVPSSKILLNPDLECGDAVTDCCVWKVDDWVPVYSILTAFTVLWALLTMIEIQMFTVSGTVAQWYFSLTESRLVGAKRRSLRAAFGPSFGTLCLSGLISAILTLIQNAINSTRRDDGQQGCLSLLVRCCLECLLSLVEEVTKFTTNFAAITGESFCTSARMTYYLLRSNFLSTVVVEAVGGRLLGQMIFVIAAVYGLLVYGLLCLFVDEGKALWSIAIFAFILLLLCLFYFVSILNNIVNTVYICYAMDKDMNTVSKSEVHDVYVCLPPSQEPASVAVRGH